MLNEDGWARDKKNLGLTSDFFPGLFLAFDFSLHDSFSFLHEFSVHYHGHTLLSLNSGVKLICKVEN